MILIWRGWGLLAVVAIFPLLGSCAGLIDLEPRWLWPAGMALSLLVGGTVCVYFGNRWNRPVVEHSFYFIPLQVWGVGVFSSRCCACATRVFGWARICRWVDPAWAGPTRPEQTPICVNRGCNHPMRRRRHRLHAHSVVAVVGRSIITGCEWLTSTTRSGGP